MSRPYEVFLSRHDMPIASFCAEGGHHTPNGFTGRIDVTLRVSCSRHRMFQNRHWKGFAGSQGDLVHYTEILAERFFTNPVTTRELLIAQGYEQMYTGN